MKRVQITIYPQQLENPHLYEHLIEAEYIDDVRTVNWNNQTSPAGFLLWVRGDHRRLAAHIEESPGIVDFEMLPLSDNECHCFLEIEGTVDAENLWANFNRGSLMTIPPIRWNEDGSNTFALIGTEEDIQAAVAGVPTAVRVDIEQVGGTTVRPEQVRGQLSNQQRKAVKTAVNVGYYDTPRGATIERIADEMGCGHSTASEHLQRAESKVMASLFETSHEDLR